MAEYPAKRGQTCLAIAVGINEYQELPVLKYAEADAVALRHFWVEEVGRSADHFLLYTDTSPALKGHPTFPSAANLHKLIAAIGRQRWTADDWIWFFFSGHGVCFQKQDYLVPIDGDPHRPAETGIALRSVYESLKATGANVLLMLDIHHARDMLAEEMLGTQTCGLANYHKLPTLLSAQPGTASYESDRLEQGLFTAVLLEGLRTQSPVDFVNLERYLNRYLPELNKQHGQPTQHPVIIYPSQAEHQQILPTLASIHTPEKSAPREAHLVSPIPATNGLKPSSSFVSQNWSLSISDRAMGGVVATSESNEPPFNASQPADFNSTGYSNGRVPVITPEARPSDSFPRVSSTIPAMTASEKLSPSPTDPSTASSAPLTQEPEPLSPEVESENDRHFWQNVLPIGLGIVAVLTVLVLFVNRTALSEKNATAATQPNPTVPNSPRALPSIAPGSNSAQGFNANPSQGGAANPITATPAFVSTNLSATESRNQAAIEAALRQQQYPEALRLLEQIPADQRTAASQAWRSQVSSAMLDTAKSQLLLPNQVSAFDRAIREASKIAPGDPVYQQAQQDIARWSQVIFDAATARAKQDNYRGAIAAAKLVPANNAALYAQAQVAIAEWQQQDQQFQVNQALLKQATANIRPGQASSYRDAINQAQKVPSGQPGAATAQKLIEQWSQEILQLSYNRSAWAGYSSAIRTAKLVPPNTAAYPKAQQAIAKWQKER